MEQPDKSNSQLASIIIISRNRLDYTRLCLQSIWQKTSYQPYEIIIVDNDSTPETVYFLQKLEHKGLINKAIFLKANKGPGYSMNQGIKVAKGNYLIRSDNDMVYNRGWLTGLVESLQRIPKALLQVAVFAELVLDGQKGGFSSENAINGIIINPVNIGGCNMALTRASYQELGPFSHDMFAEDGICCTKARQLNYTIGQIDQATATHIDDPRCVLSKRYTKHAAYRFEVLRNLRHLNFDFWCQEDELFYAAYKKSRGQKFHHQADH